MNLKQIRTILFFSMLAIALAPLALVGARIETAVEAAAKRSVSSQLYALVCQNEILLNNFIRERKADIKLLAETLSKEPFYGGGRSGSLMYHAYEKYKVYIALFLIDENGEVGAESGENAAENLDKSLSGAIMEQINEGGEYMSDVLFGEKGESPRILLAAPSAYKDFDGQMKPGALAAFVNFDYIGKALNEVNFGRTGEAYLVNKAGFALTGSRLGAQAQKKTMPLENLKLPDGVYERADYRGKQTLSAQKTVAEGMWTLIAEQDVEEAFGVVKVLRREIFVFFLAVTAVVSALTFFISHKLALFLNDRYRREKELEAQALHHEKLAAMGLLTAGLAHELNTPLANALLYAQLLKEETTDASEESREKIAVIEDQIKQSGRIVGNLLEFSRRARNEEAEIDVNDMLRKIIDLAETALAKSKIRLNLRMTDDLPRIKTDPTALQQVFTNIIANAIDAMPDGGTLTIESRYVKAVKKLKVDIGDTGPGISEKMLAKIFDPFYTTKGGERGVGLGLFVSYGIVKRHRGNIRVVSRTKEAVEGTSGWHGAVFTVELPAETGGGEEKTEN